MKVLGTINTGSHRALGPLGRPALLGVGIFAVVEPAAKVINERLLGVEHTPVGMGVKIGVAVVGAAITEAVLHFGGGVDVAMAQRALQADGVRLATAIEAMPAGDGRNKAIAEFKAAFGGVEPEDVVKMTATA